MMGVTCCVTMTIQSRQLHRHRGATRRQTPVQVFCEWRVGPRSRRGKRERERGMAVHIQCILQECQDNGLGTLNNVVTVTKNDFDVFNRMIDVSSFQKGNQTN